MRLRGTVSAPQRLKGETTYKECPRQSLRRSRDPSLHRYIDYNPNLPPAAFPTLNEPRVSGKRDKKAPRQGNATQHQDEPRRKHQNRDDRVRNGRDRENITAGVNARAKPETLPEGWVMVDGDDHPIAVSWVASNGDYNPIYTRNMNMMANTDSNTSFAYGDVEDSDYEMDISPDGGGMKVG